MITVAFTTGKKAAFYEVKVGAKNEENLYSFGLMTKAPYDAVISALRASLKDSYTLKVEVRQVYHSEYENLDTACATLRRIRFVEYSTKIVEKLVQVTETVKTEL